MSSRPTVVFLVVVMAPGWGVSVVVHELTKRLRQRNVRVVVGCSYKEGDFPDLEIEMVPSDARSLNQFVKSVGATAVIAHTSPYFELLPSLPDDILRVGWEHGDPTPEFFPNEIEARRSIIEHKRRRVYPAIDAVIASSEFLRSDIQYPDAVVINLAGDHVTPLEPKDRSWFNRDQKLRIGTLMRLGAGEAQYKGNRLFRDLSALAKEAGIDAKFEVMGRGQRSDAVPFESAGIGVHLNASDDDRGEFLRGLDVFISCSQWEGFNLPLVEAQELGTVGLAFDVGAHPEVTPFIVSNSNEVLALIKAYAGNFNLLHEHSMRSYTFVRNRFSWDRASEQLLRLITSSDSNTNTLSWNKSETQESEIATKSTTQNI